MRVLRHAVPPFIVLEAGYGTLVALTLVRGGASLILAAALSSLIVTPLAVVAAALWAVFLRVCLDRLSQWALR